jgi:hypothetical protein
MTDERLSPGEYLEALKALREPISDATSRAETLDVELKPLAIAGDLDLEGLVWMLGRAEDRVLQAVRAAEIMLATEGLRLE